MREPHVLPVASFGGDYDVVIGADLLSEAGRYVAEAVKDTPSILVIYDEILDTYGYPEVVKRSLAVTCGDVRAISVPSGEASKSYVEAMRLYEACVEAGLDRNGVIVALGGGVIGDLAGFVAATYMRGIRFVQMPTTLLSHDASIGGKVAINLPIGKNLVGAFHPPRLVLYDVLTLSSLSLTERASGLAEAIKHGVIRDPELFEFIEGHADALIAGQHELTSELLYRSCAVKARVVSVDEREAGLRAILNFGHTIGHAVEAGVYGSLSHGAAVAIGMVLETRLAERLGILKDGSLIDRLMKLLLRTNLPTQIPEALTGADGLEMMIELMRHDKKAERRSLSFVLPRSLGDVEIIKSVAEADVRQVLQARG